MKSMGVLKSLRKTYSIWYLTRISRTFYNKIRNIIDSIIDNDHDNKSGQLAWARSGSEENWMLHDTSSCRRCNTRAELRMIAESSADPLGLSVSFKWI